MRILHCCLSCFYIDNYNYQENVLPRQNKKDGHDVMIIASTETYIANSKLGYVEPSKYVNDDGIEIIRIPYSTTLPLKIMKKIRAYQDTMKYINQFKPDVILFHGAAAYEIINIAKYKEINPNVKIYIDSHEDFNNSARNFLSKELLHRMLYKNFIHKALPYIEKVLCVSTESYDFMKDFYNIPSYKLEFYPLGGIIFQGNEYSAKRKLIRSELQLEESDILMVHSGKMDELKRTSEILRAFDKVDSDKLKLVLIGSIPLEMEKELYSLIERDSRVTFVGWKNTEELYSYLCASDLYLQPGSQSSTMQNAICCGCPVMLYPHKAHKPYLKGNGFYVNSTADMINVFQEIEKNKETLKGMSETSYKIAHELLDYKKLAARLYE